MGRPRAQDLAGLEKAKTETGKDLVLADRSPVPTAIRGVRKNRKAKEQGPGPEFPAPKRFWTGQCQLSWKPNRCGCCVSKRSGQ